MMVLIAFIAIFVFIISVNFFIDIKFDFDLLSNQGKLKIVLFKFIPVFNSKIKFFADYINIVAGRKKKEINIKLELNEEQLNYVKDFARHIGNRLIINNVEIGTIVAMGNPMFATICSGTINILVSILYAYITCFSYDTNLVKSILTGYREHAGVVKFRVSILIGLYNLLWALLLSSRDRRRRKYEGQINL